MYFETIGRNKFGINSYILADDSTKSAVVIDPGLNYDSIIYSLKDHGLTLKAILLTHGHCDHIADVQKLKLATDAQIYVHVKDNELLMNSTLNHSKSMGLGVIEIKGDVLVKDGFEIAIDGLKFTTIHTPGHTKGGVCFLINNLLFTGDTLFAGSMGRTDLYGGNDNHIMASLNKLGNLSQEIKIFPGHGQSSNIGEELKINPYLKRAMGQ